MSIFEKVSNLLKSRIQISIIPQSQFWGWYYDFSHLNQVEESEDPLEIEDSRNWIEKVYSFDFKKWSWDGILGVEMKGKLREYRFNICNILSNTSLLINSTLNLEQRKLVNKEVYSLDWRVLLDEPKDEELESLEFSNKYIKFLDNWIAFKVNTRYLSNRKYLLQIWREILNDQKFDILKGANYQEVWKRKSNQLFSSFDIIKVDDSWYILAKYTSNYIENIFRTN